MSGGEFDYFYYKVEDARDHLYELMFGPKDTDEDWYCKEDSKDSQIRPILDYMLSELSSMSVKMHAIEWYYSGDIGKEELLEAFKPYLEFS